MKKFFLCLAIVGMMMAGCKKDDDPCEGITCPAGQRCNAGICVAECDLDHWGNIIFDSYEDDPYLCYINGTYVGTVSAYGVLTIEKKNADTYYLLRAEQLSGYVLYPTEYTGSVTLPECYEYRLNLQ